VEKQIGTKKKTDLGGLDRSLLSLILWPSTLSWKAAAVPVANKLGLTCNQLIRFFKW